MATNSPLTPLERMEIQAAAQYAAFTGDLDDTGRYLRGEVTVITFISRNPDRRGMRFREFTPRQARAWRGQLTPEDLAEIEAEWEARKPQKLARKLRHIEEQKASIKRMFGHEHEPDNDLPIRTEPVDEPDHSADPVRAPVESGEPVYARTQPSTTAAGPSTQWRPGGPQPSPDWDQVAAVQDARRVQRISTYSDNNPNRIPGGADDSSEYDFGGPDLGDYYRARQR